MNKEILKITKRFHDTYEKLSKEYGYETREDTKVFDINSNNGKLMYAVVNKIVGPILEENKQLKMINKEYEKLNKENGRGFKITNVQEYDIYELLSYKKYKDNWNKLRQKMINSFNKTQDVWFINVLQEIEKIEQGSDNQ